MNVWAWFAVPPLVLLIAWYGLLGPARQAAVPPTPPPQIESLRLPANLAAGDAQVPSPYVRGGQVREIRLSAFGIVSQDELIKMPPAVIIPPASELFALEAVLMAGDKRSASIGGQIYKEGDRLMQRYRIARIEAERVLLNGPRGREVLRFPAFKDPPRALPPPPPTPALATQTPVRPNAQTPVNPGQPGSADDKYRKILEMLKL